MTVYLKVFKGSVFYFENGSHNVNQTGLELEIWLSQYPVIRDMLSISIDYCIRETLILISFPSSSWRKDILPGSLSCLCHYTWSWDTKVKTTMDSKIITQVMTWWLVLHIIISNLLTSILLTAESLHYITIQTSCVPHYYIF